LRAGFRRRPGKQSARGGRPDSACPRQRDYSNNGVASAPRAAGSAGRHIQESIMTTLVLAEHDNATLKGSTLHTLTAAAQCGGGIHVLVAGHNCGAAARAAAAVAGVGKVLVADAAHFADGLAENVAEQVLALAGAYSHLLAPATAYGKNIMPRVAARLDVAQISEITKVDAPDTFERPIYAGNAIATVRSSDAVNVITVRGTGFEAAGAGGSAAVENVTPVADFGKTVFVSREVAKSDRPELTAAKIIVSGGRGLGSADNFKVLEPLADQLGAAMGASRAAVDAGFVPNDWQVGQTGKIVAPALYIAVAISGAIQHLAGMKDSKVIVAINKDPEAPIFAVADYGIVGDLFDIVPQLAQGLAA
jgi:electron transfer flavoprotein alpha subunit